MTFEHEPIERGDQKTLLVDRLEEKSAEGGLTRHERALKDVVETIQLPDPEGDGLHEFWQSALDHTSIINSFDMVASSAIVDTPNASQRCKTRNEDRDHTPRPNPIISPASKKACTKLSVNCLS